jgi:hypothetical protein
MSVEFLISSSLLSLNVLVYIHVSVGVFTRTPHFPISPGVAFNSSVDGVLTDEFLAVFPRQKGRRNPSLFYFFDYLVAVFMNRYDSSAKRLKHFSLAVFVYSVRVH